MKLLITKHVLLSKPVVMGTAGVAVVGATGLALAAWTSTGSGNAQGRAGDAQALTTVAASAFTSGYLYPGATGTVKIRINNPNSYPVTITDVDASGAITASGGAGSCTTHGVTFTDQSGLALAVPASGQAEFSLSGAAAMSNASEDGCRNALFTIPVTLSGASG